MRLTLEGERRGGEEPWDLLDRAVEAVLLLLTISRMANKTARANAPPIAIPTIAPVVRKEPLRLDGDEGG